MQSRNLLVLLLLLLVALPTATAFAQAMPLFDANAADADIFSTLWKYFLIFLIVCVVALILLVLVVLLMLWKMRRWVESLISTDRETLSKVLDSLRKKHPDLSDEALVPHVISRQSRRAGLVGFITGLGGLPAMPLMLPIDIAASVKVQAGMVHMIRMLRNLPPGTADGLATDASLLVITSGGQELTSASSAAIRQLIVKSFSKSLLKFLPLIGGVIGFGLNWASTHAMGRMADRMYRKAEV